MTQRLNFRSDNIDYKALLKKRQDKREKQQQNKNPFILSVPQTNEEVYKSLYKFDAETELEQYSLPLQQYGPQQDDLNNKSQQRSPNKSRIASDYRQSEDEYFDQEDSKGINFDELPHDQIFTFGQLVQDLFSEKKKKVVKTIQQSDFVDKEVWKHLMQIQTGEEAISFFAKYGNTTPIKFINCVRDVKKERPEQFRPYDLKTINKYNENQKNMTLDEYYTISAHGIANIVTERGKKKRNGDVSTEVISLSDWMLESTQFNIITNISFFKNYVISKIFNIWRSNVHYRTFCKTRQKLVQDGFICKPAFANHLKDINEMMYDLQNIKTISPSINLVKSWEMEDFKIDQKKTRNEASANYEIIIDKVITQCEQVCKEVIERTKIRDQSDIEEGRFGQQVKQKPMNEIRRENDERAKLLERAIKDKEKLQLFVRLIDYIVQENLYSTNFLSMKILVDEMNKEGRKMGLFLTSVSFETNSMIWMPPEEDIIDSINQILDDMIHCVRSTNRVLDKMDSYVKILNTDQKCDLQKMITESVKFIKLKSQVIDKISKDFRQANEYVTLNFEKCRPIYNYSQQANNEELINENTKIDVISKKISEFNTWARNLQENIKDKPCGVLQVEGKNIKGRLGPFVKEKLKEIETELLDIMRKKTKQTKDDLTSYIAFLNNKPQNLKDYCDYIEHYNEIEDATKDHKMDNRKMEIEEMTIQLKQKLDGNTIETGDNLALEEIAQKHSELLHLMEDAQDEIKSKKNDMVSRTESEINNLKEKIGTTAGYINDGILKDENANSQDALQRLNDIYVKQVAKQIKSDQTHQKYQKLMGVPISNNPELEDLKTKYENRKMLWDHVDQFSKSHEEWYNGNFQNLDSEVIEKQMKTFNQGVMNLTINIAALSDTGKDPVLEKHTQKIEEMTKLMPIISALGNRALKQKHWKKIFEKLGDSSWQPGAVFTLQNLLEMNVEEKIEDLEEISSRATGEAQIEEQIEEIKKKWNELNFIVKSYRDYKDKFTIGSVEEIVQSLDDHQLKVQTMLGTRHVTEIFDVVDGWRNKLNLISDILDEWLTCQRQWMYLENIFSAEDIQKQLPQETAQFQGVDKFWRDTMLKANKRPSVQDLCSSEEFMKKFKVNNQILEDIQKKLEMYLESKRLVFPRFYFLSNDELLEILSQTRNPHAVQGHLRKCFDNINRIKFTEEDESKEILGMQSAEPEIMPEYVPFSKSVMAEGPVEKWLNNIQEMMCTSLYDISKKCLVEVPENGLERKEWLFSFPAQIILVIDQIQWTLGQTQAILKQSQGDKKALSQFYDYMIKLINYSVSIVQGDLNILQRTLMGALIVLDVHCRDVTGALTKENVMNINDFDWSKQLRYYWEQDVDDIVVRQTNTYFQYAFEYLGNGPRLVITPLTDKCYITLTGAKHLQYGGAPAGPAGTGKTETTKDLAKAFAVQCVVFNCSDGLDYKTMGRFFAGLSQGGAWACFDEFNRIDIEVLSVIAQQILTIQNAIRAKKDVFEFEGRTIGCNSRFGVFITMNPGYAGRTELPDNLKALFRPVAMMIPDYGMIAEIILFSEGFETASKLSRKMVNLYKLSSEQLSKQDHYDFGMRAVKSVLVMAGTLRRNNPGLTEDTVLIRAMRDSNVPKFLEHDLPLFYGIIEDLFPGIKQDFVDYGNLQKAIENQLEKKNYQKPAKFITKIIQLIETMMVRHGVMVVGVAGTGKSTNINTLANALAQLNQEGSPDFWHKKVKIEKLNPKSVTLNELFGYTNVMTNEWTDGIAANIIRKNVEDEDGETKKWIVFDGPVDALWIENMNTVLDDNKMLCLNNGQRIKLPVNFEMVFEVNDLAVASPATVSRCGMVYMEPLHLGWKPLVETWSVEFYQKHTPKDEETPKYLKEIAQNITDFFQEKLPVIREQYTEVIPSVDNNLIASCLKIINVLFEEMKLEVPNFHQKDSSEQKELCAMVYIFAFIWSAGANLHDDYRKAFSINIKQFMIKYYNSFPYNDEVYDFYPNFKEKKFSKWDDLVVPYKYDKNLSYFNILVPTSDTVKYKYLIEQIACKDQHMLITGLTGVGKSVIIQDSIYGLDQDKFVFSTLNFSAQTSSHNLQDLFLDKDKFQRRRKDLFGPPPGRKMIVFIDDINMPALEKFGAQPVNELLRQIIDHGGFYDLKKLFFINLQDIIFIAACANPGGGRNNVSPRLFRHFNMVWIPDLSKKSMNDIFTHILKGYLGDSPNKTSVEKLSSPLVKSTVEMYLKISQEFLPTPAKSHYTFNLRDISKVFQGILMVNYENLKEKQELINVWVHECSRVFQDRLVNKQDRQAFDVMMLESINNLNQQDLEYSTEVFQTIIFGDFNIPVNQKPTQYRQIESPETVLPQKFNEYMMHHNANSHKQMNLVFFLDAIKHISKICRVLRQPRGNALLIGVGGSGRQSLTRLATFIRKYECFTIEITKTYKNPQWKDDLRSLLKISGAKNIPQTFLFSDTQIVQESFLEDINNVLNTGEISNLFGVEDYEEILNEIRPLAKEQKVDQGRESLLKFFTSNVRDNLHIVLAFSPVGEKLRNRCRMFPSLVNCCAIDWFDEWPEQALYSVAFKEYKAQERLGISEYVEQLSQISMTIHKDVTIESKDYYEKMRRMNYVTPTSYLELMKMYTDLMRVQQNIIPLKIKKYSTGLEILKTTNADVAVKKVAIAEMQPQLQKTAEENAKLVVIIEKESKEAQAKEEVCSKEAEEAQVQKDEVQEIQHSCQEDLDKALPFLQKAQKAVKNINPADIQELKSFTKPPENVRLVLNAVCLIMGMNEEWDVAKKLLGKMSFKEDLVNFQVETVPEKRWNKFRSKYLSDPNFSEDIIEKSSQAAVVLLQWCIAAEKFYKVKKDIRPKEQRLKEAEANLKIVEDKLNEKQASLKETQERVQELQRDFDVKRKKAEQLERNLKIAEEQLDRAEKLVLLLGDEAERWRESAEQLEKDLTNLIGNILISAATIAYLGPFNKEYRQKLVDKWCKDCKEAQIPVSENFNLSKILADDVTIREWQEYGLPADDLSIENAILIFNARRWPLIIDPQGQANKWIRQLKADSNINITKLSDSNFLRTLEGAIRFGTPVLLENIEEDLDPALEPVLMKQIIKKGPQYVLQMGDQDIPYNQEFKFYMTTKLPNPHYIPEISIKTTIINFTVTPQGLEDQLLVEVVIHEQVELEENRIRLIQEISQSQRQLQDLEDKILRQIGEAQGRILEDEELVGTLETSKVTSETINKRLEASKITQEQINKTRESYRAVARRGSILYFVIASLSNIDPMYQFSLDFFINLFKLRLDRSENSDDFKKRLYILVDDITINFYKNICRGLFEKDKQLYSFLIGVNIELASKKISQREWSFFQRGAVGAFQFEEGEQEQIPSYLSEKLYINMKKLSNETQIFRQLPEIMTDPKQKEKWESLIECREPWKQKPLPGDLETLLSPFQRLLFLKQVREEKLLQMINGYISQTQGEQFIKPPTFNLAEAYEDSFSTTPLIFILSPGADPMAYLQQLAKDKDMFESKFKYLSLGQGQGEKAKEAILSGRRNGDWICLQNCHLAVSWMSELEKIQENQVEADTDPNFRLWLTSMPSGKFPVPVLQSGIKITNEPPKGLQANVTRTYNEITEGEYESCAKPYEFKKLLFSLAFFHAIILERRKFGAIGWNISYEWMNSDFQTCKAQLMMYLNEQPDIPWRTLNYLIAEINYGGRVTDDKDVRLITAQLIKYFNPNILSDNYDFSNSGQYKSVVKLELKDVQQYVSTLPHEDEPEVFGLHQNANITFQNKTVREFMETLNSGGTKSSGKAGQKPEEIVQQLADMFLEQVPELISEELGEDPNSLQIFRYQEVLQYNRLIKKMKSTLYDLGQAIQGKSVMSLALEGMFNSFLAQQVPDLWNSVAYPSLKPLGSWQKDFLERIDFIRYWAGQQTNLNHYWISSMFFPQGFMTAALQQYARSNHIAIDTLMFRTEVRPFDKQGCTEPPEKGVHINGLYLEGCRWDREKMCLTESQPKILFEEVPVIWLDPVISDEYKPVGYKCPLYKTSTRKGTLSTTGHSTNFVMYLDMKSIVDSDHWIRRGVALLTQLDD